MIDRLALVMAMLNRTPIEIGNLTAVIIDAIEMEDGSGYSFNLTCRIVPAAINGKRPEHCGRMMYVNTRTGRAAFTKDLSLST